MLKKMPWLSTRRRLLVLSLVDYLIISSLFLIMQSIDFINTNFVAVNLLAICWIIISYSLDKYSILDDYYNIYIFDKIIRVIKTAIISGVFFKLIIIFFSILNSDVGDGKWIIFLTFISLISLLYEILHFYVIKKYLSKSIKWISIYSDLKIGSSISESYNLKKYGFYKSIHKSEINELTSLNNNQFGFIIEDINNFSKKQKKVLINLNNEGFKIISLINWYERYLHRYPKEITNSNSIISELLIYSKINSSKRIKRFSEFLLSFLLLILLSPLILISAFLIKIEDNGPIIYKQKRTGFAGKVFTIYKLRSMKKNAEKDGFKWSSKNDIRVTKIGFWLRKTRIDELPQLLSVIKGDMSLIGPRPERPEFDEILAKEIPNYKLRYLVRPGLSGWAQVNYPYGASIEDSKMKFSYDIYYINNLSNIFDLLILLETIRLVFNFRGSQPG